MPIAGVVIYTQPQKSMEVLEQLKQIDNVTTYGVHKGNNIIAVFEGKTSRELEQLSDRISREVPGVLGIFPAYVNFELDEENAADTESDGN